MAADLLGAMRVAIIGDNSQLDKSIKDSKDNTEKFGKSASKLGSNLKKLFTGIGFAVVAKKLFDLGKAAENLFKVQQLAETKLDATLEATGFAAGLTSDELKRMARELQNVTTVGDELTIGAQSLLLTFKSIGEDVFPRALESILDVSEGMGQGLKESTIQIGKALNDPIRGLTALSRVGIQFSDVQKDLIKGFQESGDLAAAQGVILDELEGQFGGLARAAALTADGIEKQLNNSIGDMGEAIGESISASLTPWRKSLILVVDAYSKLVTEQNKARDFLKDFKDGTVDTKLSLEELEETLAGLEKKRGQSGAGGFIKDEIAAVKVLIATYGIEDTFLIKAADSARVLAQVNTDAAAKAKAALDLEQAVRDKLLELTAVELTEDEKKIESLREQINFWSQFRDTVEGAEELFQALATERNELNEKINEEEKTRTEEATERKIELNNLWLESEFDTREELKIMNDEFIADKEEAETAARERQIKAAEDTAITLEMIQKIGLSNVLSGFEEIGAALIEGESGFKALGKVALNSIAEIVGALGAQLSAQAALAFFPFFGIPNVAAGIGASAGAAAAFAASGAIKALASSFSGGGVVAGTQFGQDSVPAMLSPTETVMNPRQQAQTLMAIANGGFSGNAGGGDTNTINISAMFSLGNDAQINQAAETLFPALQRVGRRRGATIGGTS